MTAEMPHASYLAYVEGEFELIITKTCLNIIKDNNN